MTYKNFEIQPSSCAYTDGVAIIPLLNGEILCLPEEDCTAEEMELIQAIRDDVEGRVVEVDLEQLKQQKIAEIDSACNKTILSGFDSSVKNGLRHYDFSYESQINFNGIFTSILAGNTNIEWKDDSMLVCEVWEVSEFLALYNDAMAFKTNCIKHCHSLRVQIFEAETQEEVDLLCW